MPLFRDLIKPNFPAPWPVIVPSTLNHAGQGTARAHAVPQLLNQANEEIKNPESCGD